MSRTKSLCCIYLCLIIILIALSVSHSYIEDIVDIHRNVKNILSTFNDICKEHDIEYIIYSGTLLGAVRGSDIIKWDDDADLAMTMENIDKVIELQKANLLHSIYLYQANVSWKLFLKDIRTNAFVDVFQIERDMVGSMYFTNPKARKLFPKEMINHSEMYPISEYTLGHLRLPGPRDPVPYLNRTYGNWQNPRQYFPHLILKSNLLWVGIALIGIWTLVSFSVFIKQSKTDCITK